jgi:hypothetical protein
MKKENCGVNMAYCEIAVFFYKESAEFQQEAKYICQGNASRGA